MMRSEDADCFVIDYKMPNMNGLDLASRLRNRNIAAPIILITGYPDETIPGKGRHSRYLAMCCASRIWRRA